MRIAVIGAGSAYTPEFVEGLAPGSAGGGLPVEEVALHDVDAARLGVMAAFCRRFAARLGVKARFTPHESRAEALAGAQFVILQIRVGGNAARVNDERIPLAMGLVGQETTGAGGLMNALRTIPAAVDIAQEAWTACPNAWIINYANPAGLVAAGILRATQTRVVGLCAGGMQPRHTAARALGLPPDTIRYDLAGLNHCHFAYRFTTGGRAFTPEETDTVLRQPAPVDPEVIRRLRAWPSPYLQYYCHQRRAVEELRARPQTRGEEVLAMEQALFRDLAAPDQDAKPASLARRGGGGYSALAFAVMDSLFHDHPRWLVANARNSLTLPFLPPEQVIETGCLINRTGVAPLPASPPPRAAQGLISAVAAYEALAVEAALSGSADAAILALAVHPLVGDADVAKRLWDELLEANRPYLPQFTR